MHFQVQYAEGEDYARRNRLRFMEVSARTQHNVKRAFDIAVALALDNNKKDEDQKG